MQPDWRVQDDAWPPSRDAPPEHHWTKIAHSGPNGLFLLVLSLGWWGKLIADGSGDLTEFETALADVLWVLSDIVGSLSNMPAKRAHVDEDDTPHSKRYGILSFFLNALLIDAPYLQHSYSLIIRSLLIGH